MLSTPGFPELREQLTSVDTDAGTIPLYIVGPADNQSYPGLILIHEIFGLNEHIKDLSRRFAAQGLRVFSPDLFAIAKNLPEDRNDLNAMREIWQSISDQTIIEELKSVLSLSCASGQVMADRVGTIGFCMGGAIALMFAASVPQIAWAIDFYGRILYPQITTTKPKHPLDYAAELNCPLLAIFGGKDDLITPEHRQILKDKLTQAGKKFEIKVYDDAPHAFFNDQRAHYRPAEAADAWQATLSFMRQQIRPLQNKEDQAGPVP